MLDPWITARGRAKKALARLGYERSSWAAAAAFHVLTAAERADIVRETGRGDDAVIVVPTAVAPPSGPLAAKPGTALVYIGRIHPKKNLTALIEAFVVVAERAPDLRLELAGWGADEDVAALRCQIQAVPAAVQPRVRLHGPVYGEAKARLLASARAVVLPSLSEGLPMAVLEAWAAGVPTVMTAACNLPEGFLAGAAIDCGPAPESIAAALERLLALEPAGWRAMSEAARRLHAGRFSPASAAAAWERAYAGLIGSGRAAA